RISVSPDVIGIGEFSIGPAYTKEWNSPLSPQGSISGGNADKSSAPNSRPTNDEFSFSVSTHVSLARKPDAIISSARARVGRPQTGNIGSSPVPFNCFSRYARTSSRNKSPKATPSIPSATAFAQVAAIIDSYCSLLHGHGRGTAQSGSPAAEACASTRFLRTACIATRLAA